MATFRKRSGAWQALVKKKGFGQIARTFDSKAEAEGWAKVTESEMTRGIFVTRKEAESTTLSEALDRYDREISIKKKSHIHEKFYIRTIKKSRLASMVIGTIQGKDIAGYRDKRLKEVSNSAVRLELALLSHLFTIAVKEWGISGLVNPVMQIRRPSPNKARDRRLKPGELDRILDVSPDSLKPIIRFAVETGMRRSEIAGMTWEMVDLKKRTVTLLETKNGEKRIVPLSTEAVRILSGLVRSIDGKVWDLIATSITHAFILACQTAKIEDLTFHDLRHEATSRFFEKGFNPMEVSAITGHKTLQMLKRYTHLKAEDLAERLK